MSYILDALKKAEEERRRGVAPDVMTVQDIRSAKGGNSRSFLVWLLVAALMLNAGVLAWWLGPWKSERPVKTGQKAEGERMMTATGRVRDVFDPGVPSPALPAEKKVGVGAVVNASSHYRSEKKLPSAEINTAGKETKMTPAGGTDVRRSSGEMPHAAASTTEESAAVASAKPPPPNANMIYDMNQLPPSIRRDLPVIRMSLHYFTVDPSLRLVRINGETMREGHEISNGLRLDEITADGAVFDYRHYRFRMVMQPQ